MTGKIPLPRAHVATTILLLTCIAFPAGVAGEWDFIVVGAGTTGCALSSQLASDVSKSVLVLEAGGPMGWDFGGREQRDSYRQFGGNSNVTVFDIPAENFNVGIEGVAGRPEFWWTTVPWGLQGKGVGGTGSVNSAVAFTGSPEDFDTWPEGWSFKDMEPYYKEVLKATNIGHTTSSDGKFYLQNALEDILKNQLGFTEAPLNENPVRVNTTSLSEHYAKDGQRMESCKAFLLPALHTKDNIRLEVNSPVKRILFSKAGLASGVELENGRMFHLNEGGKVAVSAGPLNTPKLLMYSGIGAASELERLDKSRLVHNPKDLWTVNEEVGAGLHDHFHVPVLVEIPEHLRDNQYLVDFNDTQIFVDYFNNRSGPLAQYLVPRLGFLAMPGRAAPDFELGSLNRNFLSNCTNCLQFFFLTLRPSFRTRLKVSTPDLGCSCRIRTCGLGEICFPDVYYKNDKDVDEAVWAMRTFIEAFEGEGFKMLTPDVKDPASLRKWFASGENVFPAWHFGGACSLGRCTDENLKVKGTENVYVADTSVYPDPIRTHNSMTAITVGRKAASHLLQRGQCQLSCGE